MYICDQRIAFAPKRIKEDDCVSNFRLPWFTHFTASLSKRLHCRTERSTGYRRLRLALGFGAVVFGFGFGFDASRLIAEALVRASAARFF
jgi:hypothetical protein